MLKVWDNSHKQNPIMNQLIKLRKLIIYLYLSYSSSKTIIITFLSVHNNNNDNISNCLFFLSICMSNHYY